MMQKDVVIYGMMSGNPEDTRQLILRGRSSICNEARTFSTSSSASSVFQLVTMTLGILDFVKVDPAQFYLSHACINGSCSVHPKQLLSICLPLCMSLKTPNS